MNRLALKHGTVLQRDENEIFEQLIMFVDKKMRHSRKEIQHCKGRNEATN